MKHFKRILAMTLSVVLALGLVLIPKGGVVKASAVSSQTGTGSKFHPFSGTDALIRDTIAELAALGETREAAKEDKALARSVENASDVTYQEARSAVFSALTADFGASQADVSALGLNESVMKRLVESVLRDNYLSGVFTDMSYTTENGKVTKLNFSVREGFIAAMRGIAGEMQVDLSDLNPEFTPDAPEETQLAAEKRMSVGLYSATALADEGEEGSDEEPTCQNHTVGNGVAGDYNEDGEVNLQDAQRFFNMVVDEEKVKGDYNDDGEVNLQDAQRFFNMVVDEELPEGDASLKFAWNEEPVKDTSYAFDENGNQLMDENNRPIGAGLLYDHETGEVSQGIVPNIYYKLESISFTCAVCGEHVVIDRSTEEGAAALDKMISAKDIYVDVTSDPMDPTTKAVDAGTDPGFSDEEKDKWLLYTEMEVAVYTDDSFSEAPALGEDGNPIIGEDGNPVYMPAMDEKGNIIGMYSSNMDNGAAEVAYFYGILSAFINDKAAYFGTPTDFWTSKNSESNPMAALKYVCNVDPETQVPPAQMTMMVRDLPQAFMAYYYQYGNELVAMRDAAINAMPEGLTDVQKQLFLHDWLAENAWFDMGAMTARDEDGNPASSDPIQMTTFGALLSNQLRESYDANGDGEAEGYYGALCTGYAAAYNLLVQAANPDVYQTTETVEQEDGTTKEVTRWATVKEVDDRGGDLVDFVQVLFYTNTAETSIAGEGFGGGWFNNVHYFSAVKLESPDKTSEGVDKDGNAWYYVDACYDDIYIECLQQYRGESDGSVNHTYFLLSPQTMAKLYGDDVERIDSLYDGYVYNQTDKKYEEGDEKYNPDDPDHLKYEKVETADEFKYDDQSYQDSWFSGAISKVYWGDDGYVYYVDGGASAASYADMLDQMEDMGDSEQGEGMNMNSMLHGSRVNVEEQDLLKKRKISSPDFLEDQNEDSQEGMFSSKEDTYAEVLFDYGTGEMNGKVVLADEVVEDFAFNEQYPALTHTVALYGDKLYFNLSNDIYVCNTDGSDVKLFKEYNEVKANSDGRIFTATSYTLAADGKDMSITNHPIGAIGVHTTYTPQYVPYDYNGQTVYVFTGMETAETMTVNIATNYSFTSAGTDVEDEERYTVEAVNFNPDYQLYGKKDEGTNDNAEFMWCAVVRDELDIASMAAETSGGSTVNVPATCTRPAYTDTRTASGVILSREAVKDSEPTGHNYVYNETEGVYICEDCKLHATVKVEDTQNGAVTLYAVSSNGMEGFEDGSYAEEITPVSTVREAETKDSGEIEIICEPDEGYRIAKVEFKYETAETEEYTVLEPTEVEPAEGEEAEAVESKYILEKEAGCVSIRVTFEQTYEITVEKTEGGSVEVIGITPEASEETESQTAVYLAAKGETVNLSVKPAEGYKLVELKVTSNGTDVAVTEPAEGADEAVTHCFEMPEGDVTVVATFVKQSAVTITTPTNGTLNVTVGEQAITSGDTVAEGATVTVVVAPNEGYKADPFYSYEVKVAGEDGTETTETKNVHLTPVEGEENTYTFVMPGYGVTIDGGFTAIEYSITTTVLPDGSGRVEGIPATAHVGDKITFTVKPENGYVVDTVRMGETTLAAEDDGTYKFTMPAADVTVTATFKEATYTVTVKAGENGTATTNKEAYQEGDTVIVTVVADEGYVVDTVMMGEKELPVKEENTCEFTMPAEDVTVTVTFKEKDVIPVEYNISAVVAPENSGTVAVTVENAAVSEAAEGTDVTVNATPVDDTMELVSIVVTYGEETINLENGGTFTMPAAEVTVTVTFREKSSATTPDTEE